MTREEAIAFGNRVIDLGLNDETQAFCELSVRALEELPKRRKEVKRWKRKALEGQNCDKCAMNGSGSKYCDNCSVGSQNRVISKERVKGEWLKIKSVYSGMLPDYICSNCKAKLYETVWYNYHDFCPNCGADMRKESHA